MSYDDFDDVDNDFAGEDSNLVKKLRAKIDELSSKAKELEQENARFHAQTRKQSVGELLAKRGYAAKVAAFVPDSVELTDEGIDSWLAEYGDAFTPTQAISQQAEEPQQATVVVNNAAEAESLRRIQAAESVGATPVNPNDVLQRINAASNMDELVAALRGGA